MTTVPFCSFLFYGLNSMGEAPTLIPVNALTGSDKINITYTMPKSKFNDLYYARRHSVAVEKCHVMNETLYNYSTEKRELLVRLEHYCAYYNQEIQEWSLSECILERFTESILNPENIELTCSCVSLRNFISIGSVPNNFITNDIIRSFEKGTGEGLTMYTWTTFMESIYWKQLLGLF